ncbi:hypothetical protein BGZ52_012987 [Haplosporangium bisporale]|nr:hypothetical protein BGZ52_012987 [Haplosporangium bisporale]
MARFCLFPIIGAAITAFFSLVCLLFLVMVAVRKDEFSPRPVSFSFLAMSLIFSLFSFAICAEIGLGLDKALYGAEICAGLMGGFWLINALLEFFQLKSMPRRTSDEFGQTRVTPQAAGKAELSGHPAMVSTPQKQELNSTEVYYPHQHANASQTYAPPSTPVPARQTTTTIA